MIPSAETIFGPGGGVVRAKKSGASTSPTDPVSSDVVNEEVGGFPYLFPRFVGNEAGNGHCGD